MEHKSKNGDLQSSETIGPQPGCSTKLNDATCETQKATSKSSFILDTAAIPAASLDSQTTEELRGLGLNVYNQDEFEQGVMAQVDEALEKKEAERMRKILEKELHEIHALLNPAEKELLNLVKVISSVTDQTKELSKFARDRVEKLRNKRDEKIKEVQKLREKKLDIEVKLNPENANGLKGAFTLNDALHLGQNEESVETEQEKRIKLGEMTPFGTIVQQPDTKDQSELEDSSSDEDMDQSESFSESEGILSDSDQDATYKPEKHSSSSDEYKSDGDKEIETVEKETSDKQSQEKKKKPPKVSRHKLPRPKKPPKYIDNDKKNIVADSDSDNELAAIKGKYKTSRAMKTKDKDDGDEEYYHKRLRHFQVTDEKTYDDYKDVEFDGNFKVPGVLWNKLFKYQKTCVRWLWELHCQEAGGIIGDEMGLGKTIQMISFLAGLSHSKLRNKHLTYSGLGPVLIVCPTTVMHQWVKELHKWWPYFRSVILHATGSFDGKQSELIKDAARRRSILVTSYNTLVNQKETILMYNWHYVILDEGHKIRNPDAQATLVCKQFRTPHRIVLSGSPIQNNLKELWSLFDFVFPGKLGTLPDFLEHFAVPIVQGGYSNASQTQVQTAYKCACILRDTINPYLLRRMKADVRQSINMPDKNEQVLFCRLTKEQREVYQEYLDSRECHLIMTGRFQVFAGLITLRKICNHPDLSTGGPRVFNPEEVKDDETLEYGYFKRSGKLIVVKSLLRLWKQQGHRVLLFTQSRSMLNILETFAKKERYTYFRIDGGTSISSRQPLINQFNENEKIFVFLLTTRVGGLGVNLTGANRVIIFDPDWNPSTDTQARERAWRIGQKRQVTIYRLITSGTVEEKIYHRQIFKQFLTNKVLKDPMQSRFFKTNDLYELFSLGVDNNLEGTETGALFAGTGSEVAVKPVLKKDRSNRFDKLKKLQKEEEKNDDSEEGENIQAMRHLAKMLSKRIEEQKLKNQSLTDVKLEVSDNLDTQKITVSSNTGIKSSCDKSKSDVKAKELNAKSARMKKKRRHKDLKMDGERIPHLVKKKSYDIKTEDNEKPDDVEKDNYVLQRLFKKTGIQGALQHEKIMNACKADYMLVEAEADRVAKEASVALKKSRSHCLPATSGVPTWTGQHGGAAKKPRFGQKKNSALAANIPKPAENPVKQENLKDNEKESSESHFDGSFSGTVRLNTNTGEAGTSAMTSDELLDKIRHRNKVSKRVIEDGEHQDLSVIMKSDNYELLTDIRNFISFQAAIDGQATTQEILDEFGCKLPAGDSARFKAMLREICDFDRPNGIGVWYLKSEFR